MDDLILESWNKVIINHFQKGLIAYERQLQAYFFLELNQTLKDCIVWIEPMIYLDKKHPIDGKIPDMIITRNDEIVAVIELKCKPWESVEFQKDIDKLRHYEKLTLARAELPLSWPPVSSNWEIQRNTEVKYRFAANCALIFAVIATGDAKALSKINSEIKNFTHLKHSID